MLRGWPLGLVVGLCASAATWAEPDAEGCKDVFLTRLKGFRIQQCDEKKFDSYTFAEGTDKQARVEGRIVDTWYRVDESTEAPSKLAVRRNYENVLKQAGWTLVYSDDDTLTEKLVKGGNERWFQLMANDGSSYELVSAQKGAMEQSVTTAEGMLGALNQDGHVALQINFDTGKATIRSGSQPIVAQIVVLIQQNPTLNLSVEGYTDNVGDPKANKALSDARARSVVAALVAKGVALSRLTAAGFGQEKPVADNGTEDGRAKNRRVELVKR
jgi:OmpA-OmpF porin, OOP family